MIDHEGSFLPYITIGLPALVLAVVALLVGNAKLWSSRRKANDMETFWIFGSGIMLPALLCFTIIPAFAYWPYRGDYHRLQPTTGVVKDIDTRFLAASQYVIVTYTTGLTVRCDDSRCATVKVGDTLNLLCTKEHQFGSPLGTDGWGCRWGQ